MGNKSAPDPITWPYICQLSWLVFDDVTEKLYTKDYIIRLHEYIKIVLHDDTVIDHPII